MYGASSDRDAGDHITSPTSVGSELDWIEPSMQFRNSRMLQPHGFNRVYDAFHLLQTDKSVQVLSVLVLIFPTFRGSAITRSK